MLDPEFDPYAMLEVHQEELARQHDVIQQLIRANHNLQHTMLELTNQHSRLVELSKTLRHELERQRVEMNILRSHQVTQ